LETVPHLLKSGQKKMTARFSAPSIIIRELGVWIMLSPVFPFSPVFKPFLLKKFFFSCYDVDKDRRRGTMTMDFQLFMEDYVQRARDEIVAAGFRELRTPEEVDEALNRKGTTLVMVNSVCGCAGGIARPAVKYALDYDKRPDHLVTVFAGQDREATERAREYFVGYPPSSPSFALLKDGKICAMVERHEIEGHEVVSVVRRLQELFDQYCDEV
jgi:putative YphP/YqiW family bacilliredoxin